MFYKETFADKRAITEKNSLYEQVVYEWNKTEVPYPTDKTVQELFEEQVEKEPHNTAVIHGGMHLTYYELNNEANKFAHYLRQIYNIRADETAILFLDRSAMLLTSIIGVLKSGGSYIPLDTSYPLERIKYIIEETSSKVIITDSSHVGMLKKVINQINEDRCKKAIYIENEIDLLVIDDVTFQKKLNLQSSRNPTFSMQCTNLAYIIYTSGTTGAPKGVMIEHASIINYIFNLGSYVPISCEDRVDFSTNIGFDLTVTTTLYALCSGAQVIVYKDSLQDLQSYKNHLITNEISFIKLVPSYFKLIVDILPDTQINKVILGGEKLIPSVINTIKELESTGKLKHSLHVYDEYGPTETTVGACITEVYPNYKLTIGKPYNNYKFYVLDANLEPCLIGDLGELYIGGYGLARGYFNRIELTTEKFIRNPFQTKEEQRLNKNTRIYKTGDLVRWQEDGNIEYIERCDFQVKIRGNRVELGEIEHLLQNHEDVFQAAVVLKKFINDDKIIAYIVPGEFVPSEIELKEFLSSKLQDYMLPSFFVFLKFLPLTINGKLDREALPLPECINNDYVKPRNEIEERICEFLAGILGLTKDKVGITNDFFKLGGDSILAIQFCSKLRQKLGFNIRVKNVFDCRTIEKLYDKYINKTKALKNQLDIKYEEGKLSGVIPLLPIQKWFFENNFIEPNHFNQAFLLKTPELYIEKLQSSVDILISNHDSFRIKFVKQTSSIVQYYDINALPERVRVLDIRSVNFTENTAEYHDALQKIFTNWQNDFNIEHGPLYCIGYLHGFRDSTARVFFAVHHLIVDAVSWRIIAEDLKDIYLGNILNNKRSSYRQWVEAINQYSHIHLEEERYWDEVMRDYDDNSLKKALGIKQNFHCENIVLSEMHTQHFLRDSNKAFSTQFNDILLTALTHTLENVTGKKVNHIILEGHGREEIDNTLDISQTTGWFTSFFPVRLQAGRDLIDSLKKVKNNLRHIPNKGIGYGALKKYSIKSMPHIRFNYLGQLDKQPGSNTEVSIKELESQWVITGEPTGLSVAENNIEHNIINVNGSIIEGRIKFSIESKTDMKTAQYIAKTFKENLENIIDYTAETTREFITVSDIDNIITQENLDKIQAFEEVESVFLANSLQEGFIYHAINQDDDAYIVQMIWQYEDTMDLERLKEAWQLAQGRFGCLRLRFNWSEELIQIINKSGKLDWRYIDLSNNQKYPNTGKIISEILHKDRSERFNLESGNLFRIYIIKLHKKLYTCLFTSHHAILDGWSIAILIDFIHSTYLNLLKGQKTPLIKDSTYEKSQGYLQKDKDSSQQFWKEYLSQIEEKGDLSFLLKHTNQSKKHEIQNWKKVQYSAEEVVLIPAEIKNKLDILSKQQGITVGAMLQFVWHKALSIYSGSEQTVVGTVVSGRDVNIDDIDKSVGLHINTLPLIVNHNELGNMTVIEAIRRIQENNNHIGAQSNVSLSGLQLSGERLFDNLFIFENFPTPQERIGDTKLNITFIDSIEKLDYPIAAIILEKDKNFVFKIKYESALFDVDSVKRLLSTILVLIEQVGNNYSTKVSELSLLSSMQYKELTNKSYIADDNALNDRTFTQLFEAQVLSTPNNMAVICKETKLTYSELNIKANNLAHYLKQHYQISPDTLVVLCLDRNEQTLIAILAVLKAGGAFVPIDPNYPENRIKYMIEDTKSRIIITNEVYVQKIEVIITSLSESVNKKTVNNINQIHVVALDRVSLNRELMLEKKVDLVTDTNYTNLAYVIYTSGTTGNPKGVMIEHTSFVLLIKSIKDTYFKLKSEVNTYSFTNYIFDIFGLEYGLPLLTGGRIELGDSNIITLDCSSHDFVQMTPSLCDVILDILVNIDDTKLFIGGEDLSDALMQRISSKSIEFINFYGPTETTIWSTSQPYYRSNFVNTPEVTIGTPLQGENVYVLNNNNMPLPLGAIGELCIGGYGLARGYLNNNALTQSKFINNPLQTFHEKKLGINSRLYKTGDLVRLLPNNKLKYIGRNDNQLKIRGHRVELSEIESVLDSYEEIRRSVVLATKNQNDSGYFLTAYYVSYKKIDEEKLVKYLYTKLPDHMIPIVKNIKSFPLTVNGKIDKRALPVSQIANKKSYIAPKTEKEKIVRKIWSDCLKLSEDSISIKDNFFYLGGNSMLAIKLFNKISNAIDHKITAASITKYPTIEGFVSYLDTNHKNEEENGELYVL